MRNEATISVRDGLLNDEVFLTITTTNGQTRRFAIKRDEWVNLTAPAAPEPPAGIINIPLECGHIAQGKTFLRTFLKTGGAMECHQCNTARRVVVEPNWQCPSCTQWVKVTEAQHLAESPGCKR